MKLQLFLPGLCILLLISCQRKDDFFIDPDHPVEITSIKVNNQDITHIYDPLYINRSAKLRIAYNLQDDYLIKNHLFYLLINDDPALRKTIHFNQAENTSSTGVSLLFDHSERVYLDGGGFIHTRRGDRFHYYIEVTDDAGNFTWTEVILILD